MHVSQISFTGLVWRLNNRASTIINEADDETLNKVKLYF